MDVTDINTNLRGGRGTLATSKSAAAQPKRDAIDDKPGSTAELTVESSGRAEAQLPAPTTPTDHHEVLPRTAATVALPDRRRWREATRVITQTVRRICASLSADSRPRPSYHPARYTFLEDALMSREKDRL